MASARRCWPAGSAGCDRRRLLDAVAAVVRRRPRAVRADAELRRAAAACARVTLLGAAVFTPQAGAAIGCDDAAARARGRAITFIFLGWSVASVLGMPMHGLARRDLRLARAPSSAMAALVGAGRGLGAGDAMPDGVRPAALSLARLARACSPTRC